MKACYYVLLLATILGTSPWNTAPKLTAENYVAIAAEAHDHYVRGEQADQLSAREEAFNDALLKFSKLAERSPSGKLFYNIANSYYQLGEYPWATLYYLRAQQRLPRDKKVQQNLKLTREQLGIIDQPQASIFEKVLPFHYKLSLLERQNLLIGCAVLLLLFASLKLWQPQLPLRLATLVTSWCAAVLLSSVIISQYFSPVYGVLVLPAPLYRDAGTHYALVQDAPLRSGLRVEVVDVIDNGQWLNVIDSRGNMGYLQAATIRIL